MDPAYHFFFRTLGNPTRLAIIHALLDGEKNVTALTKMIGLNQTAVSLHLRRLLLCRFISARREGTYRYYSLNQETIGPLLRLMDKHVNTFCSRACTKC